MLEHTFRHSSHSSTYSLPPIVQLRLQFTQALQAAEARQQAALQDLQRRMADTSAPKADSAPIGAATDPPPAAPAAGAMNQFHADAPSAVDPMQPAASSLVDSEAFPPVPFTSGAQGIDVPGSTMLPKSIAPRPSLQTISN